MRKFILFIMILLLAGSIPVTAQEGFLLDQFYDDGTVSLLYPSGWTAGSDADGDVVLSSTDTPQERLMDDSNGLKLERDQALVELVFASVWDLSPQNVTNTSVIAGYLMAWDLAAADDVDQFQVRRVEETEVSGHPATVIEYTITGIGEERFAHFYMVSLGINDGVIAVVAQTRSDLDGYYAQMVTLTQAMINTLDFIPPPYAE